MSKAPVDGIRLVLDANPNAIFEKCVHGSTPVTVDLSAPLVDRNFGTIRVLSGHSGAASISGGPEGNLPIHLALEKT